MTQAGLDELEQATERWREVRDIIDRLLERTASAKSAATDGGHHE